MIKKIMALFACTLGILLLTGCVNIQHIRMSFPDGRIVDRVVVELDTARLQANGFNTQDLARQIQIDLFNHYILGTTGPRTFVNEMNNSNALSEEQRLFIRNSITTNVVISNDHSKIIAEVIFANQSVFTIYQEWIMANTNSSTENNNSSTVGQAQTITQIWFIKHIQSAQSVFFDAFNQPLGARLLNEYNQNFELNSHYTTSDITFEQIYGTTNTALRSNAQITETTNSISLHYWLIDPNNHNQTLDFFVFSPNTSNWYIAAIAVSLLTSLIILLCNNFKNGYKQGIQNLKDLFVVTSNIDDL